MICNLLYLFFLLIYHSRGIPLLFSSKKDIVWEVLVPRDSVGARLPGRRTQDATMGVGPHSYMTAHLLGR
jgi:hypothetical protein